MDYISVHEALSRKKMCIFRYLEGKISNKYLSSQKNEPFYLPTGCSGLAVASLTAVREVLGSNRAVGSCAYRKNHCDLQPCARAVCTFRLAPR